MKYDLSFDKLINYDTGKPGISLNIELRLGGLSASIEAKVDTGSTICIFERKYGEKLGFNVEAGEPQWVGTSVGSFLTFGHWLTLTTEEFSFDSMVFFAKDENINRNVLGRHGWLDSVVIAINDYDGKLYLSHFESE